VGTRLVQEVKTNAALSKSRLGAGRSKALLHTDTIEPRVQLHCPHLFIKAPSTPATMSKQLSTCCHKRQQCRHCC